VTTKAARIEARLSSEQRVKIERAAAMAGEPLSTFLVNAADHRADEVIASDATTFVPAVYFDELLASLDQADGAPRLAAAIRRSRHGA
jgi:uncharacterized protein (DUF1778 family)